MIIWIFKITSYKIDIDPLNHFFQVLATTPDLITIVDADSGQPISTEELRFGLHVAVLVLASSPLLRTQRALEVVGPRAFGYDLEFKPVAEYTSHHPIPL